MRRQHIEPSPVFYLCVLSVLSIEQFRDTVRDCLNVTELTPFILNKLIAKIEIGSLETVDGEKQQKVSVEWKFNPPI